ncbi:hypothetical protein QBC47DRAFT_74458 [Echria macrotheca]|uniref:Uncharacterized protein n=1 Tax=Echria macrotheca TaxID=438768 RepID=A0AAJ0B534_9PEZI|nr:hypothetical protein QBC47DRAFT_74458 [Echria macrotheca]
MKPLDSTTIHDVDAALQKLADDADLLEHARSRFTRSPPGDKRDRAGGVRTLTASDYMVPVEELRLEKKKERLREMKRSKSYALSQLKQQTEDLETWYRRDPARWKSLPIGAQGRRFEEYLRSKIIEEWKEQGIWNEKWNTKRLGKWRHEETPEPDSDEENPPTTGDSDPEDEDEIDWDKKSEREVRFGNFRAASQPPEPEEVKRKREEEERRAEEEQRKAARRARRMAEHGAKWRERRRQAHNASRPVFQFLAQMAKECSRLLEQEEDVPDIGTMAYYNVYSRWEKRGLWRHKWGIMPGMHWIHEFPWDDIVEEEIDVVFPESSVPTPFDPKKLKDYNSLDSIPRSPPTWWKWDEMKDSGLYWPITDDDIAPKAAEGSEAPGVRDVEASSASLLEHQGAQFESEYPIGLTYLTYSSSPSPVGKGKEKELSRQESPRDRVLGLVDSPRIAKPSRSNTPRRSEKEPEKVDSPRRSKTPPGTKNDSKRTGRQGRKQAPPCGPLRRSARIREARQRVGQAIK